MRHSPQIALASAVRALETHRQECTAWDYESDGGCFDCADLAQMVRKARKRVAGRGPATIMPSILALMLAQSVAFAKPDDKAPAQADKVHVATCNDGREYWSTSNQHRGACSGAGGVKSWADGSPVKVRAARKGEYR